jgi:redox-sensitive bicupin YhaK (pirin superfamily)
MPHSRHIKQILRSQPTSDGNGVKIKRIAGFNLPNLSPFLMIDELKADNKSDYIGGFPPHPHRGIETLTYMINGHFQHRDHLGNVGELKSGGAQWMAAGQGIIHSEMPMMKDGALHGFQIWINQPAKDKMQPAQYHDFQPEVITEYHDQEQGLLRVIAGTIDTDHGSFTGPLQNTGVPLSVVDWRASKQQRLNLITSTGFNAMIYNYRGSVTVGDHTINQGELAILSEGELIALVANDDSGTLVLIGQPIDEPVAHYGPFVMNNINEIEQAIRDYNAGLFETY